MYICNRNVAQWTSQTHLAVFDIKENVKPYKYYGYSYSYD